MSRKTLLSPAALARQCERLGSHLGPVGRAPADIFRGIRDGIAWLCDVTGLPPEVLSALMLGCYVALLVSLVPR